MLTDEHADLFERLAALGGHLDEERRSHPATGRQDARWMARRPQRGRSRVPLVAAVTVAVVGLAAITQLDGTDTTVGEPAPTPPAGTVVGVPIASASASPPPESVPTSGPTTPQPADEIVWTRATEIGSIARSQVSRVTAGPAGFVAIGMGFDDGKNQGRVWHSTDGFTWDEPAFERFEAKGVSSVAATADAYFVLAGTNPDRLGLGEAGVSPDVQLFRSTDGRRWEPWGDLWAESGGMTSAGGVLLRSSEIGSLEWSADGLGWAAATFTGVPPQGADFDMHVGGVAHRDGVAYLRGFDAERFVVWSSTDGRTWERLPTPPAGGSIAVVPDGIVVISNPREQECAALPVFDTQPDGSVLGGAADLESFADDQWSCAAPPDVHRYDAATGVWVTDAGHPGATPVVPSVDRLGNTLVVPLIEPAKALTIWTAHADVLEWTEQPLTRLPYGDNMGSPGLAVVGVSGDTAVVFSDDRQVDESTAVLVGKVESARD